MTYGNYKEGTNKLYWVKRNCLAENFPDPSEALRDPDGLLAIGGDLTTHRLLDAYLRGIFPWFNEGQPVLWWTPDPRCVLEPSELKVSRSLRKRIRKQEYHITYNQAFDAVLEGCAASRKGVDDTWITKDIKLAYFSLFQLGYAHSVECWHEDKLVGGLYGIAMGKVFYGESMFSNRTDASKVALVDLTHRLLQRDFRLIDCQVYSRHLQMLGAKPMKREMFIQLLNEYANMEKIESWQ